MNIKFTYITPEFTKSVKSDERIIEGYASTFDIDRQFESISPTALKEAVDKLLTTNTTIFYEHKHEQFPVGRILDAKVDGKGLWIKALISATANEVWTLIQEGILNKFSIGGKVLEAHKKFHKDLGRDITHIAKLEIYEVSIVGLPANQYASFHQAKSLCGAILKALERRDLLEDALQIMEGKEDGKEMTEEKKETVQPENIPGPEAEKKVETPVEKSVKVEEKSATPVEEKKVEVPVTEEKIEKKEVEIPTEKKETAEEKKEPVVPEEKKTLTKEDVENLLEKDNKQVVQKQEAVAQGAQGAQAEEDFYYADVTAEIEALKTALTEILVVVKDIQARQIATPAPVKKNEEEIVTIQKSITVEEVKDIVEKAFDTKVGRIRLVPSRKGTIIKTDLDLKESDAELDVLLDEKEFEQLPIKEQRRLIKKSLTSYITGK